MDLSPIIISLKTSFCAFLITFLFGIVAARFVVKHEEKCFAKLLDALFILPMIFPPTVVGFLLLYLFGVNGIFGGLGVPFTWGATVLSAVVISFPIMYRSAKGAFEQVDINLVHSARTLGLSEGFIFWKIIVPEAFYGLVGGGVLAFARGIGEFGATAMIAGNIANKTRTLPLAIYSYVASGDMQGAYFYVMVLAVFSLFVLFVVQIYYKRGKGG